jgi:hypothetical protein
MKNKKLTYFLGLIVVAVWGMILYRVFDAYSGNDDDTPITTGKPVKEAYNDYTIPKDTTHLLLNYRDPFGLSKPKDTLNGPLANHHKSIIPISAKPAVNWSFIQYSGYIRNPGSKKLIALVTINGKNETLSEGEMKGQVKLIKNLRDSIKISFNGQTKYIPIKSAAL